MSIFVNNVRIIIIDFIEMDKIKKYLRKNILKVAVFIHRISKGKVTPNLVTYTNILLFVVIAGLIISNQNILAAILLVIFGLFDTLDGELARYQKVDSSKGMFLDAVSDRLREVFIFSALAYQLINDHHGALSALLVVLALGTSLMVSYVKAKGEAVLATQKTISHQRLNRIFGGGLMSFEIRSLLIILGLLFHQVLIAMWLIIIFGTITYSSRFIKINKTLA